MVKYTRRTAIQSALGAIVAARSPLARSEPIVPFEVDWKEQHSKSQRFTDATQITDDSFVVLGEPPAGESDQSTPPQVSAYDQSGAKQWTWRWPEDSSQSLAYFQAVASTDDGKLFLGGPTIESDEGPLLLAKLGTDRNVEWKKTYGDRYGDMRFVQLSESTLFLVGTNTLPSQAETIVLGIESNDGTVSWRNSSFVDGYYVTQACPHEDGCIIAGENPSGYGWLARLSTDGTVRWEQTYTSPEIDTLTGIIAVSSGLLVGIGIEYVDNGTNVRSIGLSADGEREWTTLLELDAEEYPTNPQIVSDPEGGYVICTSYGQRPQLLIAETDERATIQNSSLISPWDTNLFLKRIFTSEGKFVLTGELENQRTEKYSTWAVGIGRHTDSPSPTFTPTNTTRTKTKPSSPTRKPNSTEPGTEDPVSAETIEAHPETRSSQADGSGFGILLSVLGVLGIGYLSQYYGDNEND